MDELGGSPQEIGSWAMAQRTDTSGLKDRFRLFLAF